MFFRTHREGRMHLRGFNEGRGCPSLLVIYAIVAIVSGKGYL